ncbi:MAG: PQQ-binding-like beta-propeller repeat protein, partial [Candidatus Coatesbacteria bacterium]|nr:PQQ-binding-like beta-propeller repeat protein [Candidatus Coatesbacteria bacterium]
MGILYEKFPCSGSLSLFLLLLILSCGDDSTDDGNNTGTGTGSGNAVELLWRYKTGDYIESSPCFSDGVVYFGSFDGYIYAIKTGNYSSLSESKFAKTKQNRFMSSFSLPASPAEQDLKTGVSLVFYRFKSDFPIPFQGNLPLSRQTPWLWKQGLSLLIIHSY